MIEPGENGVHIGSVPTLPACRSWGASRVELLANLKELLKVAWGGTEQNKFGHILAGPTVPKYSLARRRLISPMPDRKA